MFNMTSAFVERVFARMKLAFTDQQHDAKEDLVEATMLESMNNRDVKGKGIYITGKLDAENSGSDSDVPAPFSKAAERSTVLYTVPRFADTHIVTRTLTLASHQCPDEVANHPAMLSAVRSNICPPC